MWCGFRAWCSYHRRAQHGATAVEYALLVTLIAAVLVVAVVTLGDTTTESLECTAEAIESQGATEC